MTLGGSASAGDGNENAAEENCRAPQTRTPSPHPGRSATGPLRLDPPGSAIQIDLLQAISPRSGTCTVSRSIDLAFSQSFDSSQRLSTAANVVRKQPVTARPPPPHTHRAPTVLRSAPTAPCSRPTAAAAAQLLCMLKTPTTLTCKQTPAPRAELQEHQGSQSPAP